MLLFVVLGGLFICADCVFVCCFGYLVVGSVSVFDLDLLVGVWIWLGCGFVLFVCLVIGCCLLVVCLGVVVC